MKVENEILFNAKGCNQPIFLTRFGDESNASMKAFTNG